MKLSQLLLQREAMLRQARLANLAYAYWQLDRLVTRITRTGLRGEACLQPAVPATGCYCPVLTALEGSQAVVEEHFTDENIVELAELAEFLSGEMDANVTFRLEDMAAKFLRPLERKLKQAGVVFERDAPGRSAPGWKKDGELKPGA